MNIYEALNKLDIKREEENIIMNDDTRPFGWCVDMTESSRILIAGCSGSGKSVALKDIIYTLMAKSPSENQFVFVDLKRVELRVFKCAPHTIAYVTEPERVLSALNNVLDIIDDRYRDMEESGQLISDEPNVWVVIDEYADLVTIGEKGIEKAIQRIAQIGRASRVGLILGTQRPCADILSTRIAVNLDVRLCTRTVNKQDSRNVIGISGAEALPDYGYGIMQIKGRNKIVKIPFLTQKELTDRVVTWIKDDVTSPVVNDERKANKKRFSFFGR